MLCCGYTLTDFPISIRLTSLALWQSNDCPSASKATLMNMDKYFMWINYERLHNHNKAKHNKTVCIFLGIYCILPGSLVLAWFDFNTITESWYIHYIMWVQITYPFPNFNDDVWKWISNYISHFSGHVITYPCWDWCWYMSVKGPLGSILKPLFLNPWDHGMDP